MSSLILPSDYKYFEKPMDYGMTYRQLDDKKLTAEFIQWGRRNPDKFAEEIFGISFMDYQRYVFLNTWNAQFIVWAMSRNAGKSILGAVYLMTRSLLVPNFQAYILCGVGSQSIEMFQKIEKLAFNAIPSFKTLTNVFQSEVVKNQANSNGFIHNPSSYQFALYNNSKVNSLNGSYDNNRSKRSSCNFYDECAFSPDELFTTSEPFITQSSDFVDGVDFDVTDTLVEPPQFPNQCIYASSAGSVDQYFFRKYRECSLRMDAGDKRYFCADINCDVVINATKRGIKMPKPLLTQEVVDARMREDKEAGLREYKNIFTHDSSEHNICKRADIIRNSVPRLPDLKSKDNKTLYGIAFDPARRIDNSAIGVAEYYEDENVGWKMKIVNVVSLADTMKKNKTPMNTPNQIEELKKLILAYNGEKVADYENIVSILVDAGSGGAGVPITDFLCEDWNDECGVRHRGLIDPEFNEGDRAKFPNAVQDKLKLISPTKYKSELFEAFIKMMDLNLIEFTEEYLNKGYINLIYETDSHGKKTQRYTYPTEEEEELLTKKGITIECHPVSVNKDEEIALKQIDAMKNEMLNIYRFKQSTGKDRFDLAPEKANKLHDDRAYVLALLAWQLMLLRRDKIINKRKDIDEMDQFFEIKSPKTTHSYFS